jgi:two-component SAPR family response regulator
MRILALDDSELALELLVQSINEAVPEADVFSFCKPSELIEFAKEKPCDIAFLDIEIWGMNGLEVAKILKDVYAKTNIIFVTAYKRYMKSAYELYPSGYVLKPVTKEAVLREIDNLRHPVSYNPDARVRVQTFGNFDVFVEGKPLMFSRLKAKEAFAYLIDRKGSFITTAEIASVLWEERMYDRSLQNQTQVIIASMMKTLKDNGVKDIVIKERNQIAIDKSKIKCDYYDYLDWDIVAVNAYAGEYMTKYSWAEVTVGALWMRKENKIK